MVMVYLLEFSKNMSKFENQIKTKKKNTENEGFYWLGNYLTDIKHFFFYKKRCSYLVHRNLDE